MGLHEIPSDSCNAARCQLSCQISSIDLLCIVVSFTEMTSALKKFLMATLGYSERTLLRRMKAGMIGGAYPTKGRQWRIKKPTGVTEGDLHRLFQAGWDNRRGKWFFPSADRCAAMTISPALIAWLGRIQDSEMRVRDNHPFRRLHRRRLAAEAAQWRADKAGNYALDDLENLGAI